MKAPLLSSALLCTLLAQLQRPTTAGAPVPSLPQNSRHRPGPHQQLFYRRPFHWPAAHFPKYRRQPVTTFASRSRSPSGAQMVLLNLLSLQKQILNMTAANNRSSDQMTTTSLPAAISSYPTSAPSVSMLISSGLLLLPVNGTGEQSAGSHSSSQLPTFELLLGTFTYLLIIGITILGNTLVILAVFSYRPLKKVQNYFIVSLAASDMLVALVVMPLHVVKFLANGHWLLGVTVCQLFTTADILLCTSSILNLCAIALDRYWAIHNPIAYAQKRSLKLVCAMIVIVWIASAVISVPPLIGWNDWTSQTLLDHCELTSEKAFVVFSACGSFFLPLAVMVIVYVKIFLNARKRIRKNRGRSALFKLTEQQADKKGSRMRRPVAASSVIALASATGAHIFRRNKSKTSSVIEKSSSSGTANSSQHLEPRGSLPNAAISSGATDSGLGAPGHSGSAGQMAESTPPQQQKVEELGPIAEGNPTVLITSLLLAKRHSLALESTLSLPVTNLAGSTSLLILQNESPQSQTPQQQQQQNGGHTIMRKTETVELKTHLKEREKISVAKEKRAAKTIAVIIFVFTFCWLPFFCAYVIMPFCPGCYLHPKVHQAFVWLGYINSSLNPFLYGILNLEFRRAFRKILCPKRVQNAQRRRLSAQLESMKKKAAPKI